MESLFLDKYSCLCFRCNILEITKILLAEKQKMYGIKWKFHELKVNFQYSIAWSLFFLSVMVNHNILLLQAVQFKHVIHNEQV